MGYDIYGQTLERGFCEVHPWVREEYPCSLCCARHAQHCRDRAEHDAAMREMEEAHWAEVWAHDAAPWFDINDPMNQVPALTRQAAEEKKGE